MLDHLRRRVAKALAGSAAATLASYGPAGLQAGSLPCRSAGLTLYLLVPRTSEHLVNLAEQPDVVVVAPAWRLRGAGRVVPRAERTALGASADGALAGGSDLVEVLPRRFDLLRRGGCDVAETIDVE